jgi:hypothetical protein
MLIVYITAAFLLYKVITRLNPGPYQREEANMEAPAALQRTEFRQCSNQKSRSNPDVQCPYAATHGEYCHRHFKHPHPFNLVESSEKESPRPPSEEEIAAAKRIQKGWRRVAPLLRFSGQGPAANALDLAMNTVELCSMDPLETVPPVYFFSLADSRKTIWGFDIRSLLHMLQKAGANSIQNPYSREPFSEAAMAALHRRIRWLRDRKYNILYQTDDVLTEEQVWNQKVLDTFLKIEALGYYANAEWFHHMISFQHVAFYSRLMTLWEWQLGLTPAEKEVIVPGHSAPGSQRLFRYPPGPELLLRNREWWARANLALIDAFIERATDIEHQKLGALYVLMALVQVSRPAAEALPWVLESVMG